MIQKYVPIRGMTPTVGDGEYVKCEDYEKLQKENEELKKQIQDYRWQINRLKLMID